MKKCTKCGETKEFSLYHKDCTQKDGYKSACKECLLKQAHARYWVKREDILEKKKQKRLDDPEWRNKINEKLREDRRKNKEKHRAYYKKDNAKRKEYRKLYMKEYQIKNIDMFRSKWAKRKALKRNAIPWFLKQCKEEDKKLQAIYKLRTLLTKATGVEHHVDHMWPLVDGGPHWSGNLQIIPAEENLNKGATVDPAIKATIQEMLAEEERLHAKH